MKTANVLASLFVVGGISEAAAKPLEVVGTGDGMELVRAIAASYTAEHPEKVVLVPPSIGSGGGIAAVGAGRALLARVARPLKSAEAETGLKAKPIFRLPTAIYAHPKLAVTNLTKDELAAIYDGSVTNWNRLGGPDLRIKVVRREDTDSSLTVLRKTMPGWNALELTPRSKIAVTTQDAVETVKEVEGAIGFGPFSRTLESQTTVMRIDGVYPTDAAYPSSVTVSYVWRESSYSEQVRSFVDYGTSSKAKALLTAHGAVPFETAEAAESQ